MGAQRIQEVTMFALLFLLLGVIVLLAAAGRIWIDAAPLDSPTIDSGVRNNHGESLTLDSTSTGKDSVV